MLTRTKANAFAPNWGQTIFQSASEMAQNNHIRERLDEMLAKGPQELQWWNSRRAEIQGSFLKELDDEKARSREGSVAGTGSVVGTPAASVAGSVVGDDAVMVESPSGKKKKKKGKKSAAVA